MDCFAIGLLLIVKWFDADCSVGLSVVVFAPVCGGFCARLIDHVTFTTDCFCWFVDVFSEDVQGVLC